MLDNGLGQAFVIEGVDPKRGTVALEIDRSLLIHMGRLLVRCPPTKSRARFGVVALGQKMLLAADALYADDRATASRNAGLAILEDNDSLAVA